MSDTQTIKTSPKQRKQRYVPLDILERKNILIQAIEQEKPIRELAKNWAVTPNEICCYLRAYGLRTKKSEKLQIPIVDSVPTTNLEQELRTLYVIQGLSTVDIGSLWQTHSNTIIFFLRAFNIPIRAKGKMSLLDLAKYQQTFEALKNDLYRMYIDENKTTAEIAELMKLKPHTILNYLKTLGINCQNVGKRFANHKHSMPASVQEIETELRRLYVDEQKSLLDIAQLWGVDFSTISKNLKRFGISTRRVGRKNCISKKLIKNGIARNISELKELLIDLYQEKGLSISMISQKWGISITTVSNYLKIFEIQKPIQTKSSLSLSLNPMFLPKWDRKNLVQLKEQLECLYVEEKRSYSEISTIFKVSIPTVKKYLLKFDLVSTPKSKHFTTKSLADVEQPTNVSSEHLD